MSIALYNTSQLRFWTEREVSLRDGLIPRILYAVKTPLLNLNKAWSFERIEGPLLTPKSYISSSYTIDDIWSTNGVVAEEEIVLRAETTASSYSYAHYLMGQQGGNVKLPLCVWQVGKSFRREENDGASAAKLRFFEFYQQEFQCIYSKSTGADYITPTIESVSEEISNITAKQTRIVASDRLPSYSEKTLDIEIENDGHWREMCSVSKRIDFSETAYVLEVAVGLDRLVSVLTGI